MQNFFFLQALQRVLFEKQAKKKKKGIKLSKYVFKN